MWYATTEDVFPVLKKKYGSKPLVEAQHGSATGPEKRPWCDGSDEKCIYSVCRCEKQKEEDNTRVLSLISWVCFFV